MYIYYQQGVEHRTSEQQNPFLALVQMLAQTMEYTIKS